MRRQANARQAEGGFTMVELLISIAVLALMMMLAWRVIGETVATRQDLQQRQEREHEIRVATSVMVRDLSAAFLSANEDQSLTERRTLFVGKAESGAGVDELRFSSMAHRVLWADANESEQTVITYFGESDPDDRSLTNLVRRELRRPPSEPGRTDDQPGEIDLLIRNIRSVKFEYYDWQTKEFKENWDSTKQDAERSRLPTRVRVTIELENPAGGDPIRYQTQVRLMLQEELKFFTN
jgi:type II secretion system protein J